MQYICPSCNHVVSDREDHKGVLIDGRTCESWTESEQGQRYTAQLQENVKHLKRENVKYMAYHETEKTMRMTAEEELSKFKMLFGWLFRGRLFWRVK